MSTFDGFVAEFPEIRIDFFRKLPGKTPPLACFLSHVHSDHLVGLETLRAPFVYCSAATRCLVLKLEKRAHRVDLAKGILEARKQTYKHLRNLLRPIPLETPTTIELGPTHHIQVTLFDANHCLGAVSFLIEGQGRAILYTGDVRAESWWINSLVRQPKVLPYIHGSRRLDKLYLDTTHASLSTKSYHFPSKAEGIAELISQVESYIAQHGEDVAFYFHVWTLGYEEVWLALSQLLHSPIHLDRYRFDFYTSVSHTSRMGQDVRESAWLCGYKVGNVSHSGILTLNPNEARIHSCEKGTGCEILSSGLKVVYIMPIVSWHQDAELAEAGDRSVKDYLDHANEIEITADTTISELMELCTPHIGDEDAAGRVEGFLANALKRRGRMSGNLPKNSASNNTDERITATKTTKALLALAQRNTAGVNAKQPSNFIKFPYGRHSSYTELRELVAALKPRDVYPCVAPPVSEWAEDTMSMRSLFGDLLDPETIYSWDEAMKRAQQEAHIGEHDQEHIVDEGSSRDSSRDLLGSSPRVSSESLRCAQSPAATYRHMISKTAITPHLKISTCHQSRLEIRKRAFDAAVEGRWHEIELLSVKHYGRRRRVQLEEEL